MAIESAADRAAFLDSDEFAVTAQWSPGNRWEPTDVKGIFEKPYQTVVDTEEGAAIGTTDPSFTFATDKAPTIAEGDFIVIPADAGAGRPDEERYKVAGPVQPDGTGMSVAALQRKL